ncbi:RAVE protein 1 C terminal-domain-containing protein [Elsinoe ampelina]|uniref:RAVE protein 1 C terminal-domain-containing protein n=1 Tax=Elsinoe ampelina TaxID=302913 RepID=A0A6A6GPE1_9PEZI|nr:RAVE protein 1 C terminal-domain-containing protein [Elsinoe ampelina]
MQAILPGQPQAELHALDHGYHEGQLVVTYISGSSIVLLNGPQSVLQTIETDDSLENDLHVVKYHQHTGRIAAASKSKVHIYGLREEIKGTLRWVLELVIGLEEIQGEVKTLSWGSDEELLVTTTSALILFNAASDKANRNKEITTPVWTRNVPSTSTFAQCSPSSSLIATLSQYDCLVKIWRRLSFESPQFDYAYLRHPDIVTHLEWRTAEDEEDSHGRDDDVLFTICADGKFRVWKSTNPHATEILSLYAEIDMLATIQPRDPIRSEQAMRRYAFVINSQMLEKAAKGGNDTATGVTRHAQEHFDEIASRKPDIIVVADQYGHMSAWGLESVGCKRRSSGPQIQANPFHINFAEGLDFGIKAHSQPMHSNTRMVAVLPSPTTGQIAVLAHHFDGRITWHQGIVRDLLSPSAGDQKLQRVAEWTGHVSPIKKVIRTASGKALISRTEDNRGVIWKHAPGKSLSRASTIDIKEHIHRVVLLRDGQFLACLHHDNLTLWDTRAYYATEIARSAYDSKTKPLCLLTLPKLEDDVVHLAAIDENMSGRVWSANIPASLSATNDGGEKSFLSRYCTFQLDAMDRVKYVLPVDPAGSEATASDFLDTFAHDVAMSYSATGMLRTHTARVNITQQSVDFLTTSTIETGLIDPALGSATSIRRAALVDNSRQRLTIWDTRSGRLDHDQRFDDYIQDLDWAATPDRQSILAVGFPRRVHVLSQQRYDYVSERPAWARIKEVVLPSSNPHPIGDSVWLSDGSLAIGAGNQLYLTSNTVDLQKDLSPELQSSIPHNRASHIHQLVRRMNGPLPVFHPQFIMQCVLADKLDVVQKVLLKLLQVLKFYTEGDEIDAMLGFEVSDFAASVNTNSGQNKPLTNGTRSYTDDDSKSITTSVATSLTDYLTTKSIPQLTSSEQASLASIIDCISLVALHSRSIDSNASRFLLFWRSHLLRTHQTRTLSPSPIPYREVLFAYHSTSQDLLIPLIVPPSPSSSTPSLTWPLARQSRLFTFLTSRTTLLEQFESLAKSAYTSSDPRNPVDCSLHYLALRKKPVLVGLWRMATWSREQGATMRLLRNDFSEARWRTAARKNAFALMGKRRFEYAAAFFLLADDLRAALGVLENQLGDVEMAVAVGRVYGGDEAGEVRDLVRRRVVGEAVRRGDRWGVSWGLWFLGEKGKAVRALVGRLEELGGGEGEDEEDEEEVGDGLRAKSFLNDDPALVVLYEQLRGKSLQTLRGALMVQPVEEWRFLTRTAGLLRRMGCDVLALDLVRNWEFLRAETGRREEEEEAVEEVRELPRSPTSTRDPRKLLRRRSSLVVDDLDQTREGTGRVPSMLDGFGAEEKEAPKVRCILDGFDEPKQETREQQSVLEEKKPTAFKEPDANSILDSFGF